LAARTFQALMAIAAAYNLEAFQLDAVNAFTNSDMKETIYIECLDGFKERDICLLLLQALYRLRQSSLLWLKDITKSLKELRLEPINEELCLFTSKELTLFFYVDDIVILYRKEHKKIFQEFKRKLTDRYEMREIGDLSWFLGIRVLRDRSQRKI
jgi:hypothetical protein